MSWALLIVEDDADIREELGAILAARGFHVFAAANGADALDIAQRQGIKPSVILLDIVMPVMDGVAFLDKQQEVALLADVPVIVITAQSTRVPRELPPTVRGVLEKPLPLAQLIHFIQDVCSTVPRSGLPRSAAGTGAPATLPAPAREAAPVAQEPTVTDAADERER